MGGRSFSCRLLFSFEVPVRVFSSSSCPAVGESFSNPFVGCRNTFLLSPLPFQSQEILKPDPMKRRRQRKWGAKSEEKNGNLCPSSSRQEVGKNLCPHEYNKNKCTLCAPGTDMTRQTCSHQCLSVCLSLFLCLWVWRACYAHSKVM